MGFCGKRMTLIGLQCGGYQQYGVGSHNFGLEQLIFIDYKIFAQDREIQPLDGDRRLNSAMIPVAEEASACFME